MPTPSENFKKEIEDFKTKVKTQTDKWASTRKEMDADLKTMKEQVSNFKADDISDAQQKAVKLAVTQAKLDNLDRGSKMYDMKLKLYTTRSTSWNKILTNVMKEEPLEPDRIAKKIAECNDENTKIVKDYLGYKTNFEATLAGLKKELGIDKLTTAFNLHAANQSAAAAPLAQQPKNDEVSNKPKL